MRQLCLLKAYRLGPCFVWLGLASIILPNFFDKWGGVADSLGNSMGERIYKLFFTTDTQTNASNSEGKFAIAVISYQ